MELGERIGIVVKQSVMYYLYLVMSLCAADGEKSQKREHRGRAKSVECELG